MEGIQVGDQGPFHSGKLLISYFVARHSTIAVVSKLASSQMVITLARSNYSLYNPCICFNHVRTGIFAFFHIHVIVMVKMVKVSLVTLPRMKHRILFAICSRFISQIGIYVNANTNIDITDC